jgi:hypothetical protein
VIAQLQDARPLPFPHLILKILPKHRQAEDTIASAASRHCIVDGGVMSCELVPLVALVCAEQLHVCSPSDIVTKDSAPHADNGTHGAAQSKEMIQDDVVDQERSERGDQGLRNANDAYPFEGNMPILTLPGYGQGSIADSCSADEWAAYGKLMDVDDLLEMPCDQV